MMNAYFRKIPGTSGGGTKLRVSNHHHKGAEEKILLPLPYLLTAINKYLLTSVDNLEDTSLPYLLTAVNKYLLTSVDNLENTPLPYLCYTLLTSIYSPLPTI